MSTHEQIRHRAVPFFILQSRIPLTRDANLVTYLLDRASDGVVPLVGADLAIEWTRMKMGGLVGKNSTTFALVRHRISDGEIEKVTDCETKAMGVDVRATRGRKSGEEERGRMEHTLRGKCRTGGIGW